MCACAATMSFEISRPDIPSDMAAILAKVCQVMPLSWMVSTRGTCSRSRLFQKEGCTVALALVHFFPSVCTLPTWISKLL